MSTEPSPDARTALPKGLGAPLDQLDSRDLRRLLEHLARRFPEVSLLVGRPGQDQDQGTGGDRKVAHAPGAEPEKLRACQLRAARERVTAPGLLAELEQLPEEEALQGIAAHRRFQTAGLLERIQEENQRAIHATRPDRALYLAHLATAVARALDPERYGRRPVIDLQGEALAVLGNSLRVAGHLERAGQALTQALDHLAAGTGDPAARARILSLSASLEIDSGNGDAAWELLTRAADLYREAGDRQGRARVLIKQGMAAALERPRGAIPLFHEALELLDPAQAPRLVLCARHNLAHALNDAGEPERALLVLDVSRALYRSFPDSWTRSRLRWLEAKIARRLGNVREAEATLSALWPQLLSRGLRLEVALVTLDLAACHLDQGDAARAWYLAGQTARLFEQWHLHRRLRDAWRILETALARQTASAELLHQMAVYLHGAWRNPSRSFAFEIVAVPAHPVRPS